MNAPTNTQSLDPQAATLTYANAGHNPPLLLRFTDPTNPERLSSHVETLSRTGTALGVMEGLTWESKTIRVFVGDAPQFDDITLLTLKRGECYGKAGLPPS